MYKYCYERNQDILNNNNENEQNKKVPNNNTGKLKDMRWHYKPTQESLK